MRSRAPHPSPLWSRGSADDVAEGLELSALEVGDLDLEGGAPVEGGAGEIAGGLLLEAGTELRVVRGDAVGLAGIDAVVEELRLVAPRPGSW